MDSIKKKLTRTAVKSTARHTVNGTVSKLRRDRTRATTLLSVGCMVGVTAGLLIGRRLSNGSPEGG